MESPIEPVPARGTREEARLPLALLAALAPILLLTLLFTPAGRLNWTLELAPALAGIAVLAATFRRFPFSRIVYACVFIHTLILTYGGYYSYAATPLGNWAMAAFGLSRNHYDRIGHLALGFFPALIIREVLIRTSPLRPGRWLTFLVPTVALAIGAFWEFIEWWSALLLDPAGGDKFLGSQGDIWDAQWDMFLALVGSSLALATLGGAHLRSMRALFHRAAGDRTRPGTGHWSWG
jgi:putative membrane protein